MSTKKKSTKIQNIKVYLPCGGSVMVAKTLNEANLRSKLSEIDPAVGCSKLVVNDDGSKAFVREMGTKG